MTEPDAWMHYFIGGGRRKALACVMDERPREDDLKGMTYLGSLPLYLDATLRPTREQYEPMWTIPKPGTKVRNAVTGEVGTVSAADGVRMLVEYPTNYGDHSTEIFLMEDWRHLFHVVLSAW